MRQASRRARTYREPMTKPTAFPLGADLSLPAVGFGTYLISDDAADEVVGEALRAGYRHVDTAEGYRNETGVGRAIRNFLGAGACTRDELFVTTKLWPGNEAWGQTVRDYDATLAALDESLQRLGLDHIDLYLIHAPFGGTLRTEQWRALVEARKQGKVRAIGVSNFQAAHLDELEAAGLDRPDANQIELHPWSQKPELIADLRRRGIQPIAYSSLVPLSTWREAPGQNSAKSDEMRAEGRSEDSPFRRMAAELGVSEAQLLLRWAVQLGYAVLPKSTNPERMRANLDLFSFELTPAQLAEIETMDRGDGVAWSTGDPSLFS